MRLNIGLIATAMLALFFPATLGAGQVLEFGSGDWRNIPEMRQQADTALDAKIVGAISEMINRGQCVIEGQRPGRVDLTVPFLVKFVADGSVDRLVVHQLNCPGAEGLLGGALLRMVQLGSFQPIGGRRAGWFRGEVNIVGIDK